MRKLIRWEVLLIVVGALSMGSGCPMVPEIQDKVVELAVGGSTSVPFHATGSNTSYNETKVVDFHDFDLAEIIDGGGIDVSDVLDIKLSGVSYRVLVPDPVAARAITGGNVTITRGGVTTPLISGFTLDPVNGATSFQTATLNPAGVTVLNSLLADLLNELKGLGPAPNTSVTYTVTGTIGPAPPPDVDFFWELKVDVSIKGTVEITTIG